MTKNVISFGLGVRRLHVGRATAQYRQSRRNGAQPVNPHAFLPFTAVWMYRVRTDAAVVIALSCRGILAAMPARVNDGRGRTRDAGQASARAMKASVRGWRK